MGSLDMIGVLTRGVLIHDGSLYTGVLIRGVLLCTGPNIHGSSHTHDLSFYRSLSRKSLLHNGSLYTVFKKIKSQKRMAQD